MTINNVSHLPFVELIDQINSNIVGQQHVTKSMIIALLTGGHILLEGLPGTAKTRAVKTLADALDLAFSRVQFTPDLLPSDITGTQIYQHEEQKLSFQPGPIFSSIVLADEINRSPAKVQAALLEAMAEGTVTVAGESKLLPQPFMVLATQNPIEQEGTYPLPEAQMDRFIMKVSVDYPRAEAEMDIIRLVREEDKAGEEETLPQDRDPKFPQWHERYSIDTLLEAREAVKNVYVSDVIDRYLVDIVIATRCPELYKHSELVNWIDVGVSPRASIALDRCSRAHAFISGRDFVSPDDVRAVAPFILGHRLILSFDTISDGIRADDVVDELLLQVPLG
ncbi:MoxR family ATPase [Vibrio sp. ZSDZ34]|uniref:MoxR family ATPase n=1 Tax=Vibrio gelatinilyticus TaxID=2893468 RepID=A0A9X1WBG5_9VIBR|nr:MoxR family ATPase [Vibrio gelatinilyticus]MCJ2377016.1 MoxR family ATPase [Vibrio gelatinilyticus]